MKMVMLPLGYCIDTTEVTRAAYATWLAAGPSLEHQISNCAWNKSFVPYRDWPAPETDPQLPVTWVDWCDAYAYCQGVGKHLCGAPLNNAGAGAWARQSQSYSACASGGELEYPYGNSYDAMKCNGADSGKGARVAGGTMKGCQSSAPGYGGVYDLIGNVREWEDFCLDPKDIGERTYCVAGGGSYALVAEFQRCGRHQVLTRGNAAGDVGFRCCAH
jgi:formylglycine-generating enzyme required for sulfatase activity